MLQLLLRVPGAAREVENALLAVDALVHLGAHVDRLAQLPRRERLALLHERAHRHLPRLHHGPAAAADLLRVLHELLAARVVLARVQLVVVLLPVLARDPGDLRHDEEVLRRRPALPGRRRQPPLLLLRAEPPLRVGRDPVQVQASALRVPALQLGLPRVVVDHERLLIRAVDPLAQGLRRVPTDSLDHHSNCERIGVSEANRWGVLWLQRIGASDRFTL